MEFLKTCNTNAQAIGDFEAIAYQAFSITRNPSTSSTPQPQDWSPSEDIRAVEAQLRQALHLVAQDPSRPWLWFFTSTTAEKAGQNNADLPQVDGYILQREQVGCLKAIDLVRPPLRPTPSSISPSTTGPQRIPHAGHSRPSQGSINQASSDPPHPPDCFALYEFFTSSVVALIVFHIVKQYSVVALNSRTLLSRAFEPSEQENEEIDGLARLHWLTSVSVHWTSSGTLVVSFSTEHKKDILCLEDVATSEQEYFVGNCVRVAPNGLLATIVGFEDPLDSFADESGARQKKRARIVSLEQNIEKWKSSVKRWLEWKGHILPNLERRRAWLRIRTTLPVMGSSPTSATPERDVLWPCALCFIYDPKAFEGSVDAHAISPVETSDHTKRWFDTSQSVGFRDPLDVAQEWFLGKPDRDKSVDAQRKAKKAEEDAVRRKEEHHGLYPSSPLNARGGTYGDLQAVSGVYPTPPDGIAPGTGVSHSDTPSVSGTSNLILAPGASNPAINISAPQDDIKMEEQQLPSTSPILPSASDHFNTSSGNDDLFEDMEEDGYGGDNINDADFDFFDGPDDDDIAMLDASALPDSTAVPANDIQEPDLKADGESHLKDDMSDPFAALENALATASLPAETDTQGVKNEKPSNTQESSKVQSAAPTEKVADSPTRPKVSFAKEPTPPLSPSMIVKALQPSPPTKSTSRTQSKQSTDHHHDSAFDALSFSRKMSASDAKYQDGRFSAHHTKELPDEPKAKSGAYPAQTKSLRDFPLLSKLRFAVGVASARKIPEITSLARAASDDSDSDSASETSDGSDDDSEIEPDPMPGSTTGGVAMPVKRKLQSEGNATPLSVTSFADSLGSDLQDMHGLHLDDGILGLFESSSWDWSLVNCPSPTERLAVGARYSMPALSSRPIQMPDTPTSQPDLALEIPDEKSVNGKESIAITQIMTDQIVSATLDILGEDAPDGQLPGVSASVETRWHNVTKKIFPSATECDLPALAGIHEVFQDYAALAKAQQKPPPRKTEGPAVTGSHMYQINPPFMRVRRADTHWDLLPPAIAFWETLGLSPISPPKNIVTFCVYPHSESLRPCLENFLLNLQLAYDSCKLGSHSRVETVVEFEGGLVPIRLTKPVTQRETFKIMKDTCTQLGKLLAIQHAKIREQLDTKIDAFVIYMVDPHGGPAALWDLCSAFWALFQAYGQGPPGRPDQPQKPDLVLQVVPMKYIASFNIPVILDPSTYINLAREVYDRCPPSAPSSDKSSLSIYSAPAFHLEEILPRNIPFKLVSEPAQDLFRENTYMHLGYAISLDGTWVTAAWTDSCGKSQAVVSYHLGTRVFRDIAKEIWQTTIEILQSRRVNWRVCIAKAGVLEREELETWVFLISCPSQINVFVTLLTAVDADPTYKITPTMPTTSTTAGTANTPGSTPQAGVSPSEPGVGLTPAATPSADASATDPSADPEARLIDVTDESWGVILAHRLHNTHSTTQFSPALISGLLVKRAETQATSNSIHHPIPDPEHGPIVLAVNFLWIGAVGSTRAASSPFPPSASSSEGVSSGGAGNPYNNPGGSAPPSPSPSPGPAGQEGQRSTTSLMWTPTPQTRTTAEGLLKEVLGQYRALGLLAKLRGMRGTRHGTLPWHIVAAKRGVEGLGRVVGGSG